MHLTFTTTRRIFVGLLLPFLWLGHATFRPLVAAEAASSLAKWGKDISAFEAADKTNTPPKRAVVFIGSSSIRLWKTLAQDFPDLKVINRGFGGSEIADSVAFLDRIVFPYEPRMVVMYAGGNDLNAGKSPEQVFTDFKEFVGKVHAKLPQTRIAYISIAPNPARWAQVERVKAVNRSISDFTETDSRLQFIDVFSHMLGTDGTPRPEIFVEDRLHMNSKGYELWTGLVKPYLRDSPDRP